MLNEGSGARGARAGPDAAPERRDRLADEPPGAPPGEGRAGAPPDRAPPCDPPQLGWSDGSSPNGSPELGSAPDGSSGGPPVASAQRRADGRTGGLLGKLASGLLRGLARALHPFSGPRPRPLDTVQSPGNRRAGPRSREILALGPWFHNLRLPGGIETAPDHPLGDYPRFKWRQIAPHLPADLRGWHVLDVGCNAGYYAFALAERGARVLGIDSDEHYLRQARWVLGQRPELAERVRFERAQVYAMARRRERFDLVLFLGVFYHLRYPLLALDVVASRAADLLLFQSLSLPGRRVVTPPPDLPLEARRRLNARGWPRMSFVERRLAGDGTNRWLPNRACCEALLRDAGFDILARPTEEVYLARRRPGTLDAIQGEDEYRTALGLAAERALRDEGSTRAGQP